MISRPAKGWVNTVKKDWFKRREIVKRKWNGINIMTIHKSKGKEFDVVVVYDGRHQNKIMSSPERKEQAILNLRVAVTRAKQHTYIFTPEDDPCPLI